MKYYNITFSYQFSSCLGPLENARYNKEINMDIYYEDQDDFDSNSKLIGKAQVNILYIDQAINDGCDLYEVFDDKEYTFRIGQTIFDFEENDIKEDIRKFYNYDFILSNICILQRIELLPEFRGHRIGSKVIKDIIFHFESGCGLFVAQVFPLQLEPSENEENVWRQNLALGNFESKESIAKSRLKNYYLSIGFDKIPKYKDLIFYNPSLKNERLSSINLDE
jgi:GNAT superfamily N-acetyltransferase